MADIGLYRLRRQLDDAITYTGAAPAGRLVEEGLRLSRERNMPAEEMYFKAQREMLEGNFGDAIVYLDSAIKLNPLDGAAYNDRALCMVELGMIDAALPYFDKGIESEPDYATIFHNKGWLLNKMGEHRQAVALFEKALGIEPGRAVTYENLADAYRNLGLKNEALAALKKALEFLPSSCLEIREQIESGIKELVEQCPL
ncbi:MAG: tetratricopeptide repeat protein [Elusimicrobia bacterium]|nr:tetratricopeptide repeat protein [Elusimicrobiota bacterium]